MEEEAPAARRDPLDTPPPAFSLGEARAVAERVFGIAGAATPLGSERDQNLRLAADDGACFLLKISNPADQREALEMQSLAMLHIAAVDPDLPVMRPQRSLDGGYHAEVEGQDGRTHIVRLFSFLPGRAVSASELQTSELWAVGAAVARIGTALRGFSHPAGGYEILWDLKHTPRLRNLLKHVSDGSRREMAERVLERFEQRVSPKLPSLRAQMIHNDLSLDNILLNESHQVSGIVDFGDLTHTALICDLAIALVSLMWDAPDPMGACRTAIEGYTSLGSIEEAEAALLGDLVGARLVALGLIARWRVDRYPENADYIMENEERTWALLDYLDTLTWPQAEERFRAACLSETAARSSPRPPIKELMERRQRVLGPALSALTYDRPLYLVRAQGTRMYDEQGAAYLDAYNNVPVVGHCHPRVTAAIAQQSRTLNTNTRYLHESVVELAERL
nr:aminotransferase class III-fold pyridoxal phosphate-dependent enzyme [Actinomycetota bacterium]